MYRKLTHAVATAAVAATLLTGTAAAKYDDPPAASFYTPRALKALGMQWEAKAKLYGKQSLSLQGPAVQPISTSPPEGILPGDEPTILPPSSCAYAQDEPC